ncbi:MBL fold metallo-hydrolase [Pseudohongiella sp. O18]|uniref:MBL fold metallo-hydrolase n=1 Tax=Pseudohongiella sp. O18 TaxID=2904248 RepID=UPI001F284B0F|nr:MBL fold metallo-hydrolase [Pseudohongiella sp. O18]
MTTRNWIKASLFGTSAAVSLLALISISTAQDGSPTGAITTRTHTFTPIRDDIYHVVGTGTVNVMSHAMLIEGEHDLLVVDSHVTPNAGMALLDAIKSVSDKPVRYLVNTHYHFDHAHGNQVFPQEVEIIGHPYTRQKLSGELGNVLEESTFLSFTESVPDQIENMRAELAQTSDPARTEELRARISMQQAHYESSQEIVPTPPNITVDDKMTIYQTVDGGGREIQIVHLGRGHTGGDVVVFLPDERLVYTGDLMVPGIPYMGDAYLNEWPDALERLKALDFDTILPGHGPVVQGKDRIDDLQAYMRDLWQRTAELKAQGLSFEEAATAIDLTGHSNNYPQLREPGADPRAIRRIYQLLDEQDGQP